MTILYTYITIFTIYYIILALISLKHERKIRDKYTSRDNNMCVVVYASGEAGYLENLIKQLKSQSYPKERFSIHVVLDKVENPPEFIFQTDLDINVININNLEPIGKSQAYSILAEKLSEAPNLDAFVFIDANNYVNVDFLSNINFYLTKYNVIIPMINYIGEYKDLGFWDCVKLAYAKYIANFIYKSRTRLGLTNLINTDAHAIYSLRSADKKKEDELISKVQKIVDKFNKKYNGLAKATLTVDYHMQAFEKADDETLVKAARKAGQKIGLKINEGSFHAGAETHIYANKQNKYGKTFKPVLLGVADIYGMHSKDEKIDIESYKKGYEFFKNIYMEFLE